MRVEGASLEARAAPAISLEALVEIDQHDHAGLGGDAGQRDKADHDRDREVEAEPPHQPEAADQREGQRQHDDQRLGEAPEVQIEQQEDDQERHRDDDLSRASARSRYSNWPLQET